VICLRSEIGALGRQLLKRTQKFTEADVADAKGIGEAVTAMIEASAKAALD